MIKSEKRNARPWEHIRDTHAVTSRIPAVVAIGGTPISNGPGHNRSADMLF